MPKIAARTNLVKRFYTWDPTINVVGSYVTLDDMDNDGIYSKSPTGSNQTNIIRSSQAFFVQTDTTGSASLGYTTCFAISPVLFFRTLFVTDLNICRKTR